MKKTFLKAASRKISGPTCCTRSYNYVAVRLERGLPSQHRITHREFRNFTILSSHQRCRPQSNNKAEHLQHKRRAGVRRDLKSWMFARKSHTRNDSTTCYLTGTPVRTRRRRRSPPPTDGATSPRVAAASLPAAYTRFRARYRSAHEDTKLSFETPALGRELPQQPTGVPLELGRSRRGRASGSETRRQGSTLRSAPPASKPGLDTVSPWGQQHTMHAAHLFAAASGAGLPVPLLP